MTDTAHDRQFRTLAPAADDGNGGFARRFGVLSGSPVIIALFGVVALSGVGWIVLGLMAAGVSDGQVDVLLRETICWPAIGHDFYFGAASQFAVALAMWCAMVLAMMLPTAGPMIVTYAEIADAAARKGEKIISPLVLMSGYLLIWFGFALVATALQLELMRATLLDPAMRAASPYLAGAIFIAAGAHQFSALKHACVKRCQRPFPFFFANWTEKATGVFRLGLRQGLDCLGCCWAMMLVMFAVGVMNVVWMAALGVIMGTEKIVTTQQFTRAIGVGLIAIGLAVIVSGSLL